MEAISMKFTNIAVNSSLFTELSLNVYELPPLRDNLTESMREKRWGPVFS